MRGSLTQLLGLGEDSTSVYAEASLEIVQRDGDCLGAGLPGNLVDLLLEGGLTGRGSAHTG